MPTNSPSEAILTSVVQGDQTAFAKLYRHYHTPALKFCYCLLKDQEEAENMVHDVFVKLWERRTYINPTLNFSAYLFTCLRNTAFDHLKQVEKSELLKQRYLERMLTSSNDEPEAEEARINRMLTAVNALSEKRRLILLLTVEGDKSYQEIAELLKISKNTVKNQLVKARQLLREQVDFALL